MKFYSLTTPLAVLLADIAQGERAREQMERISVHEERKKSFAKHVESCVTEYAEELLEEHTQLLIDAASEGQAAFTLDVVKLYVPVNWKESEVSRYIDIRQAVLDSVAKMYEKKGFVDVFPRYAEESTPEVTDRDEMLLIGRLEIAWHG